MVVHPGAGNIRDTLVNALLFHCKVLYQALVELKDRELFID